MAWQVRYPPAERERRAKEAAHRARAGRPPIEAIPEPAELDPDLLPILEAWRDLQADRGGMGGPIPWVAISCWCEDHGIRGDERLRTIRLVRACDIAHLAATRKASKEP